MGQGKARETMWQRATLVAMVLATSLSHVTHGQPATLQPTNEDGSSDMQFCPNDCSSHGQCRAGACECHVGWGGEDCSADTLSCAHHCYGHGSCLNGTCTCDIGYTGLHCELVVQACPNNCTAHGSCRDGLCVCHGPWQGPDCATEIYRCPPELLNCSGRGVCGAIVSGPSSDEEDVTSTTPWACQCDPGFCGTACNRACPSCPNNCSAHGQCDGSTCRCDPGFGGPDCSMAVASSACPNNCSSAGVCVFDPTTGVMGCECYGGWSGLDCADGRFECPRNCSGHGTCSASGCVCDAGFLGDDCSRAVGHCEGANFCSGGGVCVDGACHCYPGYSGFDCNYHCVRGFNGTISCNHDKGRGLCVNGTCVCKPEWTGIGCEDYVVESFEDYAKGWNPIGAAVLGVMSVMIVAGAIGMLFKRFGGQKQKGLNSVPSYNQVRSKVG